MIHVYGDSSKMIGIGILGAGNMARVHAAEFAKSGRARICAIHAPDECAAELAAQYGAKNVQHAKDLFEMPEVDAVVIASPTHTHCEYLECARQAQKHVLCEKPVVRTFDELSRVEALFANYSKVVMAGHTVRFFPEYSFTRERLVRGELGNLGVIHLWRCAGFALESTHWLFDFQKSGGAVLDLMIHDLDFLEWAAGPIESVFALRPENSSLQNDACLVVARLRSGALAHLECSWAEPAGTFYYGFEIAGSDGICDFDSRRAPAFSYRSRHTSHCSPAKEISYTPTSKNPYSLEVAAFIDAVEGLCESPVPLSVGIRAVRLALSVLDSSARREEVLCSA